MKLQLFFVLFVAVGAYAFPAAEDDVFDQHQSIQKNAAEDRIRAVVQRIINRIQNAGLDPLNVEKREFDINPVFLDFAAKGFIEKLDFSGLSDIRINHLEYSYIFNRLRIDVSIPEIKLSLGDSDIKAVVRGRELAGQLSGSLSINNFRLRGLVYVDVNIIGLISIRSIDIDSSLGSIEADLSAMAQGVDRSEYVNNLINVRVPAFLENNKDDIDRVLASVVSAILTYFWNN